MFNSEIVTKAMIFMLNVTGAFIPVIFPLGLGGRMT